MTRLQASYSYSEFFISGPLAFLFWLLTERKKIRERRFKIKFPLFAADICSSQSQDVEKYGHNVLILISRYQWIRPELTSKLYFYIQFRAVFLTIYIRLTIKIINNL